MMRARVFSISRVAVAVGLGVHAVMFVWVVGGRLTFPFELEWMTGSVLDHVERVRAGVPVYVEPSSRWIPFLYPPLYYWVCAPLGGSVLACRLVSLATSLLQLVLVRRIARDLRASRFWSLAASGLFVGCFSYVGWWYDLERADSLYSALVVAGAAVLVRARGPFGHVVAGVCLAIAFLAKQQSVFYVAGAGAGLVLAARFGNERARLRDVVAFGASAGLGLVLCVAYAMHRESAWFKYYVLDMPRAHGVLWRLAPSTLGRDLVVGFALVGATVAAGVVGLRRLRTSTLTRAEIVFSSMLLAGFAGAVASRLHIGGWINVLQPWTALASIATAVFASRLEGERKDDPRVVPVVACVIVAQLAVWTYDPGSYCPPRKSRARHENFATLVRSLEQRGEVMIAARGHMTAARHPHVSALADVVGVEGHAPAELRDHLVMRSYAAIIDAARDEGDTVDEDWPPVLLEDVANLGVPLLANYHVAERLDDDTVSLALRSPVKPVWVYLPRSTPLTGASVAELRRRQLAEMRLATAIATARREGRTLWFDASRIEALAAADVGAGR